MSCRKIMCFVRFHDPALYENCVEKRKFSIKFALIIKSQVGNAGSIFVCECWCR